VSNLNSATDLSQIKTHIAGVAKLRLASLHAAL